MILVTGGTGYIGSHIAVELLKEGYSVVLLDDLSNSVASVVPRIEKITGRAAAFYQGDVRDAALLASIFEQHPIDAVIHCAGLKAVGESVTQPLAYYDTNVHGSIVLCQAMAKAGIKRLIFSSSATVYGVDAIPPYVETMGRGSCTSPYGTSKAMVEQVLEDLCASDPEWSVAILRYFNPIGAHPSGLIGESPQGVPNNLMPYISQVAAGVLPELQVYGNDYPTQDGTCVRDYLHVVDLAAGHRVALKALETPGASHYNLGTGQGVSVKQMIDAFTQATQVPVAFRYAPRRDGDLAAFWASAEKAQQELGWQATQTLDDMMIDTWRWQQHTSA
ncbi:UDP-glucose 4-epimerase GalE [Vreelandella hamiltonii]|uniref:UDP-glucose 4-epimerase n=2 Tax=Halomonas johnsoniae TaxID=502832 RepID=A0ABQ2WDG3_9GAMM|nr:UDP-glucose 4-epimerase [Halomonas johnsoniae]